MHNKRKLVLMASVFSFCALPVLAENWATATLRFSDYKQGVDLQQISSGFSVGTQLSNTEFWLNGDYSRLNSLFGLVEYGNLDFGSRFSLNDNISVDVTYSRLVDTRDTLFFGDAVDRTTHYENAELGLTWQGDNWFIRAGFAALDDDLPNTQGNYWSLGGGVDFASDSQMTIVAYIPRQGGSHILALGFKHSTQQFDINAHYLHASEAQRIFTGQIDWHLNDRLDLQGLVSHQSYQDEDRYSSIGAGLRYQFSDRATVSGTVEHIIPDNATHNFTAFGLGIDFALGERPKRRMNFAEQAGRPAFFEDNLPGDFFRF